MTAATSQMDLTMTTASELVTAAAETAAATSTKSPRFFGRKQLVYLCVLVACFVAFAAAVVLLVSRDDKPKGNTE